MNFELFTEVLLVCARKNQRPSLLAESVKVLFKWPPTEQKKKRRNGIYSELVKTSKSFDWRVREHVWEFCEKVCCALQLLTAYYDETLSRLPSWLLTQKRWFCVLYEKLLLASSYSFPIKTLRFYCYC